MSKSSAPDGVAGNVEIDENLHSRQLAVYGREAMKRMATSSVLISGANGLGVEIGEAFWSGICRRLTMEDFLTKHIISCDFVALGRNCKNAVLVG